MKKILLILLSVMLVAGCCKTEPPVVEKTRGLHYFYVDNRTDEELKLSTMSTSDENDGLPSEFQINRYPTIHIYPNAKTLVRVFATDDALNLFYYSVISPYFNFVRSGTVKSETIWKAEYWKYNQYEEWKSEYVMVLTPELLNDLF